MKCDSLTTTAGRHRQRHRQHRRRLRAAQAGGVRHHRDRATRRTDADLLTPTRKGLPVVMLFPSTPTGTIPTKLPLSGLFRHQHDAGRRRQQGDGREVDDQRHRDQGGRQQDHSERARPHQIRADHARARRHLRHRLHRPGPMRRKGWTRASRAPRSPICGARSRLRC